MKLSAKLAAAMADTARQAAEKAAQEHGVPIDRVCIAMNPITRTPHVIILDED